MRWVSKGRGASLFLIVVSAALFGSTMPFTADTASAAAQPSRSMRHIVLGTDDRIAPCTTCSDSHYQTQGQFSEVVVQEVADTFTWVGLTKYHAKWRLDLQFEDAKRIKAKNPKAKVMLYFNSSLTFFESELYPEIDRHESWFLHQVGQPAKKASRIPFKDVGYYLDYTNPEFRAWYTDQIVQWVFRTDEHGSQVIDGVKFDNAHLYDIECRNSSIPACQRVKTLIAQIGLSKVKALNTGLVSLFSETSKKLNPDKVVIFNGIANFKWVVNNSLGLMSVTNGAANEQFGFYATEVSSEDMLRYVNLPYRFPGKYFFQKTNLPAGMDAKSAARALRKIYGCFLLSHQPGYTFFKVGSTYTVEGELPSANFDPPEVKIEFGKPLNKFYVYRASTNDGLRRRDFEKGSVLVNLEGRALILKIEKKVQLYNGGVPGAVYPAGQKLTIPAQDALFLKNVP